MTTTVITEITLDDNNGLSKGNLMLCEILGVKSKLLLRIITFKYVIGKFI